MRSTGSRALRLLTFLALSTTAAWGAADSRTVGIEEIAQAIQSHIAGKSAADGGTYRLPFQDRELNLQLVRVHMEYLADLGGGVQFACVDLADIDGTVFDVDFHLKGDAGAMDVTETTVHKINGQPLYAWEQQADETWIRIPMEAASDLSLGVVRDRDEFDFTYRVRLPQLNGAARLWLPLASSDSFQQVDLLSQILPSPARRLLDDKHGNHVLLLELGPAQSGAAIEMVYHVQRRERSPYLADPPPARPEPGSSAPVKDGASFRQIALGLTGDKSSDLMKARALYDHVIESLRYARYGSGWGQGDALNACTTGSGNCTDFHAYFIALAEAAGIPARFAIGASIPSERDSGGIDGYHCWAEFCADGVWWPVDISEADKYSRLATYYFGHQPANRVELSRGRDLLVEPGPASGPINFLAHPVLEVEGVPVKTTAEFLFRRLGTPRAEGR